MSVDEHIRRQHPGWVTISEAAKQVGKSVDTLRRWAQQGHGPSRTVRVGKLRVGIYSEEDIERLKEYAKTVRPGRPRRGREV